MSRCMVGSREGRDKIRCYYAILRVVDTKAGRRYRGFAIPTGVIVDLPMNTVTLYCAWCKKPRNMHANNQCLFAPTKFRPFMVRGMRNPAKTHGHTEGPANMITCLEKARG